VYLPLEIFGFQHGPHMFQSVALFLRVQEILDQKLALLVKVLLDYPQLIQHAGLIPTSLLFRCCFILLSLDPVYYEILTAAIKYTKNKCVFK
jgi:hypothetical protein